MQLSNVHGTILYFQTESVLLIDVFVSLFLHSLCILIQNSGRDVVGCFITKEMSENTSYKCPTSIAVGVPALFLSSNGFRVH